MRITANIMLIKMLMLLLCFSSVPVYTLLVHSTITWFYVAFEQYIFYTHKNADNEKKRVEM